MKNPAIDCILALGDSDIPAQKIPPSILLVAFVRAFKRSQESAEEQEIPPLFIEEMKKSLADPVIPDTQATIMTTQKAIAELEEAGDRNGGLILSTALLMLQSKLAKEAQLN